MNKKTKIFGVVVVVLLIVFTTLSIKNNDESGELTFGMIVGSTGDYAVVGESFSKGALLAQEQWNSVNPDQQIKIIIEDDGFDPKLGLSAYRKLVGTNKIDGLINMTTITIDVIYDDVIQTGLPVSLGFEQGIEAADDNVVQLWPGTVPAEKKLGEYVKEQGYKNMVVFVENGSPVYTRFFNGFKEGYDLPLTEIRVNSDTTDVRSSALKAVEHQPDAIVFILRPTQGALLIKEIENLSTEKFQYIFDANIQTGFIDYLEILGDGNKLNGSILYTVPNIYREDFEIAFKNKFNEEPTIGSETGYNAFILLSTSYDPNKEKWVENMKNANFVGADGEIVLDENGIRIPRLEIGTIKNGQLPN